jgi:hypothetical protein
MCIFHAFYSETKESINKSKSGSIKYKIYERWKDIFLDIIEREFFPLYLAAV